MGKVVILGTAHRRREAGKQSPDGVLKEYLYSREIVGGVKSLLLKQGCGVFVDMDAVDLPKEMQTPSLKLERQRELALRVNYVNSLCKTYGSKNCFYVSIHVNAAGNGNNWMKASGWQVCVSPNASMKSRILADMLAVEAFDRDLSVREPKIGQRYWEQSIYILNKTLCPAVLTENMFMDNKDDVQFLLSDSGREKIIGLHVDGILNYLKL